MKFEINDRCLIISGYGIGLELLTEIRTHVEQGECSQLSFFGCGFKDEFVNYQEIWSDISSEITAMVFDTCFFQPNAGQVLTNYFTTKTVSLELRTTPLSDRNFHGLFVADGHVDTQFLLRVHFNHLEHSKCTDYVFD